MLSTTKTGPGAADLRGAFEVIRQSKHVVLTGMGSSLFACIPAEHALRRAGIAARSVEAGELLHYGRDLYEHSCVVMVSRSGESIEVERLLEAGAATVIGVTNVPDSTLARRADRVVLVNSLADEMVAIQTYTATLATLLLLAGVDAGQVRSAADAMTQAAPPDEFLTAGPLYFLGRGPSLASCLAGQLAMHEVAKTPAVAMSAPGFRHGPLEVIDGHYRAVIFAPEGRSRELNRGLAEDIRKHGGETWLVECGLPDLVAPIAEAVPAQLAAYRLAKLRGLVPGLFRHATQVTRTE